MRAAERLFNEGYYEDAISRAYYAIYHAARAALASQNVLPKIHEGVVVEFGKRFVLSGVLPKDLGRILANAKASRETHEYSVTVTANKLEAEAILSDARTFVNKVREHLAEKESRGDNR
ncbi:MAG: HEPN domain-containing protein [Candidatus Bathyarchaeia archaeon]